MKIAILSMTEHPTPPPKEGGVERSVSELAEDLLRRGHQVKLFALEGSRFSSELHTIPDKGKMETRSWRLYKELMRHKEDSEIVHDNTNYKFFPRCHPKEHFLVTSWGDTNRRYRFLSKNVVCVSRAARDHYGMPFSPVVPAGLPRLSEIPFFPKKEEYLVAFSQITPFKGVHVAIAIAQRTGDRLIIGGRIKSARYFQEEIAPHLNDRITYVGEVGADSRRKWELFGKAKAYLFPTLNVDADPSTLKEAMACGTPVIALANGGASEIVIDGKTGFVCQTVADMIQSLGKLDQIDPAECRKHVEKTYTLERMVDQYEALYHDVLSGRTWGEEHRPERFFLLQKVKRKVRRLLGPSRNSSLFSFDYETTMREAEKCFQWGDMQHG
ncbi:MAG: glycosyltransferase [Candidatus Omnitrophota bacterium]